MTELVRTILIPTFLPLLVVIFAGSLMGRLIPKLDDRTFSASMLYVFTPALVLFAILTASNNAGKELAQIAFFWFFHSAILLVCTFKLLKLLRYSQHQRRLILLTVMILNAANYPIPLNEFQYGEVGRETAIRIMLITQLVYVSVGVYLASDRPSWAESLEEIFRLPLIYAAVFGFILYFVGVRLPGYHGINAHEVLRAGVDEVSAPGPFLQMFGKLLTFLQAPALPLNLLILGIIIGKGFYVLDFDSYKRMVPAMALSAVIRLVFSPVLALGLLLVMKIEGQLAKSLLIHTAMPTAIYVSIFVAYYGQPSDKRFAALAIIFSTLISFITIPLWVLWIDSSSLACFQNEIAQTPIP